MTRRLLPAFAAMALLLSSLPAHASAELDRRYALEVIGYLRSVDNVDGLFADYVAGAYADFFNHQGRFIPQDLAKADEILAHSRIPYRKLVEDPKILAQVARSTHAQSLLRTKIQKEGPVYRFSIDWLHPPEMSMIAREGFDLTDQGEGKPITGPELKQKLGEALTRLTARIPWSATVTGRSEKAVTVNAGSASGIQPGDTLVVGTLEEAKVHPLLKETVDWNLSSTGRLKVVQVEERMAFCEVESEEAGHEIAREQKIIRVVRAPVDKTADDKKPEDAAPADERARIGWASVGLNLGNFSRELTSASLTSPASGSGFAYGGKAEGQLWLTREWFAEMSYGLDGWSYSPTNGSATGGSSSTLTGFKLAGGYSYLVNNDIYGTKGWLKIGYHSNSFSLPISTAANMLTNPISFHSVFLGIGGDLPVRGVYGFLLDLDFGVLNGMAETGNTVNTAGSASDVGLTVGGYYRYTPRITFKFSMDAQFNNGDFTTSKTATATNPSLSQKIFTFGPSILYYF